MFIDAYKHRAVPGSPLAEVSSVIISPYYAEECQLYGTIRVDDDEGSVYIYNLEPEDSETIKSPNDSLILSNRDRAIFASNNFTVYFDLKDKNNGDAEFISNFFSWDVEIETETDGGYNKLLVKDIKGQQGSARVYYTVHSIALEASIRAQFIPEKSGMSDPRIYVRLIAHYKNRYENDGSQDSKEKSQVMIFEGELPDVEEDEHDDLELDRSIVTLPSYAYLVVGAYFLRYEDDELLWKSEVEFSARDVDKSFAWKVIQGTCGVIRVTVRAFCYVGCGLPIVKWMKDNFLVKYWP